MTVPPPRRPWTVVLPLKGGPTAKSRLGAPAPVARAMALDCLAAVLACPDVRRVLVVTPDAGLGADAAGLGAEVLPESAPGEGLLAALADGIAAAGGPCAVLLGDLPALRPADLGPALSGCEEALRRRFGPGMAFVPDAAGTGTVLLAALRPAALRPSFGPGSAAAHAAAGGRRLDLDLPRLRQDVDTPADLAVAVDLGVGPRTRAALRTAGAAVGAGQVLG